MKSYRLLNSFTAPFITTSQIQEEIQLIVDLYDELDIETKNDLRIGLATNQQGKEDIYSKYMYVEESHHLFDQFTPSVKNASFLDARWENSLQKSRMIFEVKILERKVEDQNILAANAPGATLM